MSPIPSENPELHHLGIATEGLATVIPIYKERLTLRENQRVTISLQSSEPSHSYFVGPHTLNFDYYAHQWPDAQFVTFDPVHFKDVVSYNRWMLCPDIYERFKAFEFILLCQTDAILVKALPLPVEWKHFDYLGAPWDPPWILGWDRRRRKLSRKFFAFPKRTLIVGNGGLSLRRTAVFRKGLKLPRFVHEPNEDIAISYFHRRIGVRLAKADVAESYFMELGATRWVPGVPLPEVYGFHALEKHNPRLEEAVIERFLRQRDSA